METENVIISREGLTGGLTKEKGSIRVHGSAVYSTSVARGIETKIILTGTDTPALSSGE